MAIPNCVQNGNYIFDVLVEDPNYQGVRYIEQCAYGPAAPTGYGGINLYEYVRVNS